VVVDSACRASSALRLGIAAVLGTFTSGQRCGSEPVMAGDFNSSPVISGQESTHPAFVARAEAAGLVSVFHFQEGVAHGAEAAGTLRRGKKVPKQYHIDYCFVSKPLAPAASLSIIKNERWSARGDHWPLILDIPNAAFGQMSA
jgi:exodeoxyribonuclease-3